MLGRLSRPSQEHTGAFMDIHGLTACALMQIYACPIYECIDTAWGRRNEGTWSFFNIAERFVTRSIYIALTTFVAALLPFFGDFIALTGSLSALPLDFVLVLAMTLKVCFCPSLNMAFAVVHALLFCPIALLIC